MANLSKISKQAGEVALFIVIFSAMLIVIIVVSFTRIMIADQKQSSNTDLSQSAYDSALAGVEDAKRALARYELLCSSGGDCSGAKTKIASLNCNEAIKTLNDVSEVNGEVKVQSDVNSAALDQAYTCVKILLDTGDYVGKLSNGESKVVSLKGTESFDTVQLEWFSASDLGAGTDYSVSLSGGPSMPLLSDWPSNRPSIMRSQLIQFSAGSTASSLDNDSYTLFLYPLTVGSTSGLSFSADTKTTPTGRPSAIKCNNSLASGGYACTVKVNLPKSVDTNNEAFMRLTSIYNNTSYRITLYDSATAKSVNFNGVQPIVDSTGRTNDLFRRVQARVEMANVNFPYPISEIYTKNDLCKAFVVTDNSSDYSKAAACSI